MPGTPPFCKPPGPETSSRTGRTGRVPGRCRERGAGGGIDRRVWREPWLPGRSPPGGPPRRTLAGTAPHSSSPQTPASAIPAKAGIHLSSIFQESYGFPLSRE